LEGAVVTDSIGSVSGSSQSTIDSNSSDLNGDSGSVASSGLADLSRQSLSNQASEMTTEEQLKSIATPLDEYRDNLPLGLSGSAQGMVDAGYRTQVANPQLTRQWESTSSAWNGGGGFTDGAIDRIQGQGVSVLADTVHPTPAGSRVPGGSNSAAQSTTFNGDLARDAIASRYRNAGLNVETEVHYDSNLNRVDRTARLAGDRFIDVAVDIPHDTDPRMNQRLEIESKAYRVNAGSIDAGQLNHDARSMKVNGRLRTGGAVLEGVGKVARPVGLVLDAVEVGSAFHADGNQIGENTGRAVSRLAGGAAGGWGGAAAGAAIGTAILPGVGTVIGGVIGGIGGAFAGDAIADRTFSAVKNFFSW
jgi:hypothetical protein